MAEREPLVLNHKTEDTLSPAYVSVDWKRLRFNRRAQEMCALKVGKRLSILYFGDYDNEKWTENLWFFMVNESKDGIEIKNHGRGQIGAHTTPIASKLLKHAIASMENRKGAKSMSFMIERTPKEYKGNRLWKINIYNAYASSKDRPKH